MRLEPRLQARFDHFMDAVSTTTALAQTLAIDPELQLSLHCIALLARLSRNRTINT